jgi:hypothetical protein
LRASTREAIDPVGEDVGTPVLHLDGSAWFGPVLTEVPRGMAAADLYDGILALSRVPGGVARLKRGRSGELRVG